ncbi:hypothetical protein FHS85_000521 [Rhodoligotrophos appendicifer]|uniref:hypothetical protein n=1 Tax=Rhodoligotrophos appendicifer TaxID=987056 RepID=UPI00117E9F4D|nr:hypothetical protein [Rhodoligotrophos appendicifer]
MLRLAFRTLPLFAVIVGFAIALGAYMNFSGVRGAYLELIRSRMEVVAKELDRDVDSAVSLGIPLSEQITLPALLARQASADPLILSIDVASPEGKTLFSSKPDRDGATEPSDHDPEAHVLSHRILNDFGASVGTVVIRYSRAETSAKISALGKEIIGRAVPAGVLAVLAGCLAAFLVLTRLHNKARTASHQNSSDAIARAESELHTVEAS